MSIPNLYFGLKKTIAKRRPAARCIRHTSFPSHGGGPVAAHRPPPVRSFGTPAVRPRRWESTRAQQFHVALSWLADVFERRALPLAANAPAPLVSPGGLAWTGQRPCVSWSAPLVCLVCLELTDFLPLGFSVSGASFASSLVFPMRRQRASVPTCPTNARGSGAPGAGFSGSACLSRRQKLMVGAVAAE